MSGPCSGIRMMWLLVSSLVLICQANPSSSLLLCTHQEDHTFLQGAPGAERDQELEGETVRMLDAVVQLMQVEIMSPLINTGVPNQGSAGEFDRSYLTRLSTCMASLSPDLWAVSDGAWAGIVAYHDSDGSGMALLLLKRSHECFLFNTIGAIRQIA